MSVFLETLKNIILAPKVSAVFRRLRELAKRANALAQQFYTPRELRALALFLLIGIGILLFRFGKGIYLDYFPNQRDPKDILAQHEQDSLFFALSAAANQRDSLFFSLPEDSLLPASMRNGEAHHSKTEGLRLHSISLNLGTKFDLMRLPGVGSATAERILEYREVRGGFRTLEEVENIHGIGEGHFEKMRRFLRLN